MQTDRFSEWERRAIHRPHLRLRAVDNFHRFGRTRTGRRSVEWKICKSKQSIFIWIGQPNEHICTARRLSLALKLDSFEPKRVAMVRMCERERHKYVERAHTDRFTRTICISYVRRSTHPPQIVRCSMWIIFLEIGAHKNKSRRLVRIKGSRISMEFSIENYYFSEKRLARWVNSIHLKQLRNCAAQNIYRTRERSTASALRNIVN